VALRITMEDGEQCNIASPADMSVTSSSWCMTDESVKVLEMIHSSDGDGEVSSSCEMQSVPPASSSTVTDDDVLNSQVTSSFTYICKYTRILLKDDRQRFCTF